MLRAVSVRTQHTVVRLLLNDTFTAVAVGTSTPLAPLAVCGTDGSAARARQTSRRPRAPAAGEEAGGAPLGEVVRMAQEHYLP